MGWSKLIDLEMDDEDQLDAVTPYPVKERAQYPYGLRISLCHTELEKLGLELPDVGDVIDLRAFAVVTSVSSNDGEYGSSCRVELQIEKLAVENEMTEDDTESEDD